MTDVELNALASQLDAMIGPRLEAVVLPLVQAVDDLKSNQSVMVDAINSLLASVSLLVTHVDRMARDTMTGRTSDLERMSLREADDIEAEKHGF
jgi:hypothetical protein